MLVEDNREHLSPWMPWAAAQDREGTRRFVQESLERAAANNGFAAVIVERGAIRGVAAYHAVDWRNRTTSVGFWVARDAQGRGLVTRAVRALVDHAFAAWGLNRVELRAMPDNARSRAIAERLGFAEEGLLREAERHADGFRDHVVYAMLARDWPHRSPRGAA